MSEDLLSAMNSPRPVRRKGKKVLPWRLDADVWARLSEVDRRHLAGESNHAIASALAVDEKTVRNDLRRCAEVFRERAGDTIEAQRYEAIRRIERYEDLAAAAYAWDLDAERAVLFGTDADGKEKIVQRDLKGSAQFRGNKAGALAAAIKARMDIAKLQGLVVEKIAPTDAAGKTLDLASLVALARQTDA